MQSSRFKKILSLLATCYSLLFLAACATITYPPLSPRPKISGVYHRVEKGQTLWRISQAYNIDIQKIVQINRLSDASKIDKGQLLFIPSATETIDVDALTEKQGFIWPLKRKVIVFYGTKKNNVKQKGINIRGRQGEKVIAARSGRISFCSDYVKGYGKLIIIDHSDKFQTIYAHNYQNLVKQGDEVKQGTVIAKVGSTGRVSAPQLHFEIRKDSCPKNPFYYLP